jgi:hypothetical protein
MMEVRRGGREEATMNGTRQIEHEREPSKRVFAPSGVTVLLIIGMIGAMFLGSMLAVGIAFVEGDSGQTVDAGTKILTMLLILSPVLVPIGRLVYVMMWNRRHQRRVVAMETEAAFVGLLLLATTYVVGGLLLSAALGPAWVWIALGSGVVGAFLVDRAYLRRRVG